MAVSAPSATFDLVREGWLPCRWVEGGTAELGLLEALAEAHRIAELSDPSPLVTVSLHRLLLAVLHRVFGPRDLAAWAGLWSAGRWDRDRLEQYFAEEADSFDLFDPERPFFGGPPVADRGQPQTVWQLAQEAATGNNATLFDHRLDDRPEAMSAAEAARYLVARQGFSIGFGKSQPFYFKDGPLIRGYSVLAQGATLFETLALNLVVYNEQRPIEWVGEDKPAWEEREPRRPNEAGTTRRGYLDYLTWPSRSIRLMPEGEPVQVRLCTLRQGLVPSGEVEDPFKAYVVSKQEGVYARSFSPGRVLWRDSHALLAEANELDGTRRPALMNHLAGVEGLRRRQAIKSAPLYRLAVFGLATDPGKAASVVLWRQERLPLPLPFLEEHTLRQLLREVVRLAEEIAEALRAGARTVARLLLAPTSDESGARQPDPAEVSRLAESLGTLRAYWPTLELPFAQWTADTVAAAEAGAAGVVLAQGSVQAWIEAVERAATTAWVETVVSTEVTARAMKAASVGERVFRAAQRKQAEPARRRLATALEGVPSWK